VTSRRNRSITCWKGNKALQMKRCPRCGIERASFDTPCQICGYAGNGNNAPSGSVSEPSGLKLCPFCGEEIKSTAKKCKHCGEFLSDMNEVSSPPDKVQTIERTSKKYKLQLLLSTLLTFVSLFRLFGACVNVSVGLDGHVGIWGFGFIIGLIWFCAVRFNIWWHHG